MLWRPILRRQIRRPVSRTLRVCSPIVRPPIARHALALPALFTLPAIPSLSSLSELLLTHPYPTYTTTIVLLTLAVRSVVTLPVTIWARRRMQRMREIVRPEMKRVNERLAVEVAKEGRGKGWAYDEYKKVLKARLADVQSALVKKHKCHPLATALAPPLIHIPIFLLLSLTIRQAAALATPPPIDLATDVPVPTSEYVAFATEHTLWLTSLVEPDPQLVIPFAIGLMAFANVEVMQSWRREITSAAEANQSTSTTTSAKPAHGSTSIAPAPQQGLPKIKPNFGRLNPAAKRRTSIIQDETNPGNMSAADARRRQVDLQAGTMRERVVGNVMRILAVVTVGIAAEVPAAVAIYWFTSTGYTLVQNIILGYLDRRQWSKAIGRG